MQVVEELVDQCHSEEVVEEVQTESCSQPTPPSPSHINAPIPAASQLTALEYDSEHVLSTIDNTTHEPDSKDDVSLDSDTPDSTSGLSTPELVDISPSTSDSSLSTPSHQDAGHSEDSLALPVSIIEDHEEDPWALDEDLPAEPIESTSESAAMPLVQLEVDISSITSDVHHDQDAHIPKLFVDYLDDNPWNLDDEISGQPETSQLEEPKVETSQNIPTTFPHDSLQSGSVIQEYISTSGPVSLDDDTDPWGLDEIVQESTETSHNGHDIEPIQVIFCATDASTLKSDVTSSSIDLQWIIEPDPAHDEAKREPIAIDDHAKSTTRAIFSAAEPKGPTSLAKSLSSQPSEFDIGDAWDDPWETADEDNKQTSASQLGPAETSSEDITTNGLVRQGSGSDHITIILEKSPSKASSDEVVSTPSTEPVASPQQPEPEPVPEQSPCPSHSPSVEPHASHAHPESPLFRDAPRSVSPQLVSPRPLSFPNISSISRPLRAHSPNHPNWAVAPSSPPPARSSTSSPHYSLSTTKPSSILPAKRTFATRKSAPIGQRRGSWLALDHSSSAHATANGGADEDGSNLSAEVVSSPESPDAMRGFAQPGVVAPLPVRIGSAILNGHGRRHTMDSPDWAVAPSPSPDFARSDSPWSSGGEGSGGSAIRRRK